MFGPRIPLFHVFGFRIAIDLSWFLLAILITWSLAEGVFGQPPHDFDAATRWILGAVGALGLFVSIVLHELGHALIARTQGIEMKGITLFIFGGVAEMGDEPPSATAEFLVAIAGPLVSVAIGLLMLGASALTLALDGPAPLSAVTQYLGFINLVLVVFNMIPAFPLDGGRVLRAAIWRKTGDLRRATRITSAIGSAFGMFLIALGLFSAISGAIIAGVWWFVLGMFLRAAANMSMQHVLLRQHLAGEPVSRFMTPNPQTVPPDITLRDLVERYIYQRQHKLYPVVEGGRLIGCVTINAVRAVEPNRWSDTTVREVMEPTGDANSVRASADAMHALARLRDRDLSRLMVVDDAGELVGVLALRDLLGFFSMKLDLEGA
ncbi:MAG: M50 family metallopeptidase [Phycisphaerales bacterium]